MRKTARAVITEESAKLLDDIKKLGFIALKHPDPVIKKEARAGAGKLLKLLTALGVGAAGTGAGLMAADKGGAVPAAPSAVDNDGFAGYNPDIDPVNPAPEDYGPLPEPEYEPADFDSILEGAGLGEYAGRAGSAAGNAIAGAGNAPSPVTPEDFDLGPDPDTSDYDRNRSNTEQLLEELFNIDGQMQNNTLPPETVADLMMKRDALMNRLDQTGYSEDDDYYK